MTNQPRVTIGLPVYNGAAYLAGTIESILRQDLAELELIIGDNGSEDETELIGRSAAASDPRVRYERSDVNRGATWNYNRLVPMARAPLFKWAAHDDLLAPSFLRRCVEELDAAPDAVLAYPRTTLIGARDEVLDGEFLDGLDLREADPVARFRRYLLHPGEQHPIFGVIRVSSLERTPLIGNFWGGDQLTLTALLLQGPFHEVPERLFMRRYHPGTSMAVNTDPAAVARWHDPNKRGRTALPRTRLTAELVRVAMRADLPVASRARCVTAVGTDWMPRFWRVMAGELKRTTVAAISGGPRQRSKPVSRERVTA